MLRDRLVAILRCPNRPLQQRTLRQLPIQMLGENVDAFGLAHGIFGFHFRSTLGGPSSFPFRLILTAPGSDQSHKRS